MDAMFEVPGSTVSSVLVNQDVVEGVIPPVYEHGKESEDSALSNKQWLRGGV